MMDTFEGYVGIRLWNEQLVDDVVFGLLFVLFMSFALVFRSNYRLFIKMVRDVVFIKERQNLFEAASGSGLVFKGFMIFQALFLCGICLFAITRIYGYFSFLKEYSVLLFISLTLGVLLLFYLLKQCLYYLLGMVFTDSSKFELWKTSYNAVLGAWGVLLYIPAVWLMFVGSMSMAPVVLFVILYILCRFAIIYKTIRIFHSENAGLLYISLYLCGQEILPLVFLYEGIVYLYNFIEASILWH